MGKASLWGMSSICLNELPNLQDLFISCDHSLLMQVILEDFACREVPVDKKQYKAMRHRLEVSLDAMKKFPVAHKPARNWILMPRETYGFSARDGTIVWRIHAAQAPLLDRGLAKELVRAANGKAFKYKQVKRASRRLQEYVQASQSVELKQAMLDCWERSYALEPWEETLGCRVWLGGAKCTRERYAVLASAYWEMTFYGFEYEKVQARIMQEQVKRLEKYPSKNEIQKRQQEQSAANSVGDRFALRIPDQFFEESRACFARRIAVLNHRANVAYFEHMLDLAQRLERGLICNQ